MPTWLLIVLLVIVALIALLAIGGAVAGSRRRRAGEGEFDAELAAVNDALARARAEDKGWDRAMLEAAAREAFAADHPEATVESLRLVQVVDKPGVEDDQAVFEVTGGGRPHRVVLARSSAGEWIKSA